MMKSKLTLIVFSTLLAILLTGCSKKLSSKTNTNSNESASNTNNAALETSNAEETADDSSTTTGNRAEDTGKNTRREKPAGTNPQSAKRSAEKETPVKAAEKRIKKQGDRILRDTGGLINEGERKVRGILDGKP